MGLTHVKVALKGFAASNGTYEADFLVDTGATDCLASASELKKIGVREIGRTAYERAKGRVEEYSFGLVEIRVYGRDNGGTGDFWSRWCGTHLGGHRAGISWDHDRSCQPQPYALAGDSA